MQSVEPRYFRTEAAGAHNSVVQKVAILTTLFDYVRVYIYYSIYIYVYIYIYMCVFYYLFTYSFTYVLLLYIYT